MGRREGGRGVERVEEEGRGAREEEMGGVPFLGGREDAKVKERGRRRISVLGKEGGRGKASVLFLRELRESRRKGDGLLLID